MDNRQVGNFIAGLRKSKSMTQKELAEKLGVTDKAVSKWERGLGYPDISILPSLADVFAVTVEEILSGVHSPQIPSDISDIEVNTQTEKPIEIENTTNEVKTNGFFKKKHIKIVIFIQIIISAIIVLTAVVSLLYAREMGSDAIWQTLKGLLEVWLMVAGVFGFLPLLSCYLWDRLHLTAKTEK